MDEKVNLDISALAKSMIAHFKKEGKFNILLIVDNKHKLDVVEQGIDLILASLCKSDDYGEERINMVCLRTEKSLSEWITTSQPRAHYDYVIFEAARYLGAEKMKVVLDRVVASAQTIRLAIGDENITQLYAKKGVHINFSVPVGDWETVLQEVRKLISS